MMGQQLAALIKEFAQDEEVYEICMYILHSDGTMHAAEGAQSNGVMAIPNIPPESLMLMARYSSGMVNNSFYHKHFAAISTAVVRDHIRSKVLFANARHGDKEPAARRVVRDMIANRYDALTTVIFLQDGYDKAFEFEMKLKTIVRATDAEANIGG